MKVQSKEESISPEKTVLSVANFFDSSCFSAKFPKVECSALADFSASKQFHLVNSWGMHWENSLNTCSVRNLTYGERGSNSVVVTTDTDSLKYLNTLFFALANFHVNSNGVSGLKRWEIMSFKGVSDFINNVHVEPLFLPLFPFPKETVEYSCYRGPNRKVIVFHLISDGPRCRYHRR